MTYILYICILYMYRNTLFSIHILLKPAVASFSWVELFNQFWQVYSCCHLQPGGPWSSPVRFLKKKKPCGKTHDSSFGISQIRDSLRHWGPVPWKNWSLDWLPTTTSNSSNSSWPKINSTEGCPKKTHEFIDILGDDPALPTQYGMWLSLPGYIVMCPVVLTYNYVVMS